MAGWGSGGALGRAGGTATDASHADGVTAEIGGQGLAIGEETSATGDATLAIVDRGPITVVTGTASITSTAASPVEEQTSVQADTFASATGADFVFTFTTDTFDAGTSGSEAWETATSTTRLFAVDIHGFDFATGPQTVEIDVTRALGGAHSPVSGNLATATADSDAYGDATYTLALTDTFATDTASSVAVDAYGLVA